MVSGGYSLLSCVGFSCGSQAVGTWAQLLWRVAPWHVESSGIKPESPALAGGFLTIRPPGKSALLNTLSCLVLSLLCDAVDTFFIDEGTEAQRNCSLMSPVYYVADLVLPPGSSGSSPADCSGEQVRDV